MRNFTTLAMLTALWTASTALAGPYSLGSSDPTNAYDPAVPGFVGNYVNPEFIGWAEHYVNYNPAPLGIDQFAISEGREVDWGQPSRALGPVTAVVDDIVSLGELYDPDDPPPLDWAPAPGFIGIHDPGEITLTFDAPAYNRVPIRNGAGADFAVFENGFFEEGGGAISSQNSPTWKSPPTALTSCALKATPSRPSRLTGMATRSVSPLGGN